MKTKFLFLSCCLSAISAFGQTPGVKIQLKLTDVDALPAVEAVDTTVHLQRIFPYSPKYEARHQSQGLHLWYKASVADSVQAQTLLDKYNQLSGVQSAKFESFSTHKPYPRIQEVSVAGLRSAKQAMVNDPLYPKQWHFSNQMYPNGIDINLEKAWQLEKGSRDVIVAVMDEPIDYYHEDLKPNVWTNEAELNGKPGVDDDGNGQIDDIHGYSYIPAKDYRAGDHGTHVAGVIAAVNNNGLGVSSIAGGDGQTHGVKVMGCHILKLNHMLAVTHEQIAQAYVYAADNGAVISQNSWAGKASDIIADGVNYFMDYAGHYEGSPMQGGLVIWAAGNDNTAEPGTPETYPKIHKDNLIIVSSVGPDGGRASYSNFGDWVNIAAPGGEFNSQAVLSTIAHDRYGYNQGTSMACPHVSGVAALVVSKYKGKDLTPQMVKQRILTSVQDVDRYSEAQVNWRLMGAGIIDAEKALLENKHVAPQAATDLWVRQTSTTFVDVAWKMPQDADDHAIDSCFVYYSDKPFTEVGASVQRVALFTGGLAEGDTMAYRCALTQPNTDYYFRIQGKDRWGNLSPLSEAVSGKTSLDRPLIYGDYLYNRFFVYQQEEGSKYIGQEDSLALTYQVVAPSDMALDCRVVDPGKSLQMTSFAEGKIQLSLMPCQQAAGTYQAQLIVASKADVQMADTLSLTYVVRTDLQYPIPAPELLPDKQMEFPTDQMKGTMDFCVTGYVKEHEGGWLYYDYDHDSDREMDDFSHGLMGDLEGDTLHVAYEFSPDIVNFSEENSVISVPVDVTNEHGKLQTLYFKIVYTGATSTERIDAELEQVYYEGVTKNLVLRLTQPASVVRVYSMSGYMMAQYAKPSESVSLAHLPAGTYLIQVITPSDSFVKKISKR